MIVAKIYGGLAGQMLQYSLGRALSLKHNVPLLLDLEWFQSDFNKSNETQRDFGLDKFQTQFSTFDNSFVNKILRKLGIKTKLQKVKEKTFTFDENVLNSPNNAILDGYWFSYKYFDAIKDVLRKDFTPLLLDERNQTLLSVIKAAENPVAVHIRRGDYVSNPNANKFHGVLPLEYYKEAVRLITDKVKNPTFYVFSDDARWVKEHFSFLENPVFVDFNGDANNHIDIFLMSNCKHNIIANSGFSWWGAYLNDNKNKTVIAPETWFLAKDMNPKDVKPNDWISI